MSWECNYCGRRTQPVKEVKEDEIDWPAGRCCWGCGKGEIVYRPFENSQMLEKGSKLKAKCPHCDNGCEKCSAGYGEVAFGTEDSVLYSLICNNCGSCAGGGFIDQTSVKMLEYCGKHAMCPFCGGKDFKKVIEE